MHKLPPLSPTAKRAVEEKIQRLSARLGFIHGAHWKWLEERRPPNASGIELDEIGAKETVKFITGMFDILAEAYFKRWKRQNRPAKEFEDLLPAIRYEAMVRARALWVGRVPMSVTPRSATKQ